MTHCNQNDEPTGRVFWITGLAGAGKTTLAQEFYARMKAWKQNVILLDGDQLREIFPRADGYGREDRLQLAQSYGRLCRVLSEQGSDVICATISLFAECHRWNRENLPEYYEIYVRVPMEVLERRDTKQLYSRARRGEIKDVVGVDLPFDEPESPNVTLDNDGSRSAAELIDCLVQALGMEPENES